MDSAIHAENLGKCYQIYKKPVDRLKQSLWRGRKQFFEEFWAIRDASFGIRRGETLGIIGSNGSGKSTLLQLICGILRPTEGILEVKGRIAALLELGAGFNPEFTGRENVLMNAAIMGLSRSEINERYDDIVAFAGIGRFIDQPVKTYSSGMYVRLAFATAISVSPDILVVDEALAVGDARFQQKCMARIRKFCETGTAVFVSHDIAAVTELCSRVLWIENGRIRMEGLPKFVAEKYLQHTYQGDVEPETIRSEPIEAPVQSHDMTGFISVDETIRQFGNRRAAINRIRMRSQGSNNGVIYAGRPCEITMILEAYYDIANPIIGYMIKDRLGRDIFGDNTLMIRQDIPSLSKGRRYMLTFKIENWPNLQDGEYALSAAVADGTQDDHAQCHYLHDALIFKIIPLRTAAGIFSVPSDVTFEEVRSGK